MKRQKIMIIAGSRMYEPVIFDLSKPMKLVKKISKKGRQSIILHGHNLVDDIRGSRCCDMADMMFCNNITIAEQTEDGRLRILWTRIITNSSFRFEDTIPDFLEKVKRAGTEISFQSIDNWKRTMKKQIWRFRINLMGICVPDNPSELREVLGW